jgi:HAD superfamily phosphatase (TIGR01668 family)
VFSILTPHARVDRVSDITVDAVRALGLRGLLLDVDCTLKDHGSDELPDAVRAWLDGQRAAGTGLCLVSNARGARLAPLARALGVPFVATAFKPLPFAIHTARRVLALRADHVGMVGDQLFADTLAGRLAGVLTILVRPTSPIEPWFTRAKRPLERAVLRRVQIPSLEAAALASEGRS